jgi:hypothetical protein
VIAGELTRQMVNKIQREIKILLRHDVFEYGRNILMLKLEFNLEQY